MARARQAPPKERRIEVRFADVKAAQEAAEHLKPQHLECREMGHIWRPWSVRWVPDHLTLERILRCTRCRSKKKQEVDRNGTLISRGGYEYADGYSLDIGRIAGGAKDALRLVSILRQVETIGNKVPEEEAS